MDELPLIYPCEMPVKVFGRNDDTFRGVALAIVRSHFEAFDDDKHLSEQLSRADRYVSLTMTVQAESREQMDALYKELTTHDAILMAL